METTTKHCHQYAIKLKNLAKDLNQFQLSEERAARIRITDLRFEFVEKSNLDECRKIAKFIEEHEWLKRMPNRPTHRFAAYYGNEIVAVNVLGTPYSKSSLLGRENWGLEKLIARGASISFAPKNIGSWLIKKSIDWMVQNTEFRFFTAYCDTEAFELGSIYQACNFIYLGKNSGGKTEYYDPAFPKRGWFSDRVARRAGQYKRFAKNLGIEWKAEWSSDCTMNWHLMPKVVEDVLKFSSKDYLNRCQVKFCVPKHKYIHIQGRDKRETRKLLEYFYATNPKLKPKGPNMRPGLPYPKVRGQ